MKRIGLVALATALIVAATACGEKEPAPVSNPTTTTVAPTTTTTAPPTTQPAPEFVNFLTGEADMKSENTRPVAVMIANDSGTFGSQYGIETADMIVEGETEGGITRLMAVWADVSRMPKAVGPVRSARTPFVKLAVALDTVYAHCGGSPGGLATLKNSNLAEIDGQIYDGSTFWRDSGMAASMGYDHSMLTSGSKIKSRIQNLGFRTTGANKSPFVFGNKATGTNATEAQVRLSSIQTVSFKYDAKTGRYTKRNGTLSGGSAHVSASGKKIDAANVIIMYDQRYVEQTSTWNSNIYGYNMQSGSGKVLTGGKMRDIAWSRTDSGLSFTETDGTPLTVAKGRTYLCFAYQGYANEIYVK